MVLEAAEDFIPHTEVAEGQQSLAEPAACRGNVADLEVGLAQPPQRVSFAALVAGLPAHSQRALEPQAALRPVASLERGLAQHEFAFAFDLLVPELARDGQALLQMHAGLRIVA